MYSISVISLFVPVIYFIADPCHWEKSMSLGFLNQFLSLNQTVEMASLQVHFHRLT